MKYNVGDKVRIKSIDWYDTYKDKEGIIYHSYAMPFIKSMSKYCGQIATIRKVIDKGRYELDLPNQYFLWNDYMFEDRLCDYAYRITDDREHNKKIIEHLKSLGGINGLKLNGKFDNIKYGIYYYISTWGEIRCCNEKILKEKGYILTEFKECNTMEERVIKISLETAKEWYKNGGELRQVALQAYKEEELTGLPKTWEECYKQLGDGEYINEISSIVKSTNLSSPCPENYKMLPIGLGNPMLALCQLLVCRDVYRQGWKPDWNRNDDKYIIKYDNLGLYKEISFTTPYILSFQSPEVRDLFIDNFRHLIKEARGLF